jgi:hypothetical protein
VKKKCLLTTALFLGLLLSSVVGALFVNLAGANPWLGTDWVSPTSDTKPPTLTITSPQKGRVFNSNDITFSFHAYVGESETATYMRLMKIYFKADWEQNETYVYNNEGIYIPYDENAITEFSYNMNLTGIPEGRHYITVHAIEWGAYINDLFVHMFSINGSSSVSFTVDVSPNVSVLSLENITYNVSDVPLEFTVNEPYSRVSYSLDGQNNVTIIGNTTLTGLPNGGHNVIVYGTDEAGNVGVSQTVYFEVDVPEPFPTTMVIASVITVAVVGVGLLVYFKKRKRWHS